MSTEIQLIKKTTEIVKSPDFVEAVTIFSNTKSPIVEAVEELLTLTQTAIDTEELFKEISEAETLVKSRKKALTDARLAVGRKIKLISDYFLHDEREFTKEAEEALLLANRLKVDYTKKKKAEALQKAEEARKAAEEERRKAAEAQRKLQEVRDKLNKWYEKNINDINQASGEDGIEKLTKKAEALNNWKPTSVLDKPFHDLGEQMKTELLGNIEKKVYLLKNPIQEVEFEESDDTFGFLDNQLESTPKDSDTAFEATLVNQQIVQNEYANESRINEEERKAIALQKLAAMQPKVKREVKDVLIDTRIDISEIVRANPTLFKITPLKGKVKTYINLHKEEPFGLLISYNEKV